MVELPNVTEQTAKQLHCGAVLRGMGDFSESVVFHSSYEVSWWFLGCLFLWLLFCLCWLVACVVGWVTPWCLLHFVLMRGN